MIRQPEFVTRDVFKWACNEVKEKKGKMYLKQNLMNIQKVYAFKQCT